MRGETPTDAKLFSYVSLEERVAEDHPLRAIRRMTDEALASLSERFDEMYARCGGPAARHKVPGFFPVDGLPGRVPGATNTDSDGKATLSPVAPPALGPGTHRSQPSPAEETEETLKNPRHLERGHLERGALLPLSGDAKESRRIAMKTTKAYIPIAVLCCLFAPTSYASSSYLRHRDPSGTLYSTTSILFCQYETTPVKTFMSTYDYCGSSAVIIIGSTHCSKNSGGPTPTCGANPYRITSNLYRDGNLIGTKTWNLSGAWAQQSFDSITTTPGNYYATQKLERRNATCTGWVTVETKTTNSIFIGYPANAATVCFASPTSGSLVRLRNKATGKCMYSTGGNGGQLHEWSCGYDPVFNYVLDSVGNGGYRIRWEADSQCTYTSATPGDYAAHWGCWNDPNMVFGLIPASGGGYRLWHFNNHRSLYSSSSGPIRSTVDSTSNEAMVYFVETISMSGYWTQWLDRDDPGGSGDYETRVNFPAADVCGNPIGIVCQTVAGKTSWDVGEGPTVTCNPTSGGVCVNSKQPDGVCEDYRVKFYCP